VKRAAGGLAGRPANIPPALQVSTASFLPLLVPEKRLAVYAETSSVVVPSLQGPALDTMTTRRR